MGIQNEEFTEEDSKSEEEESSENVVEKGESISSLINFCGLY